MESRQSEGSLSEIPIVRKLATCYADSMGVGVKGLTGFEFFLGVSLSAVVGCGKPTLHIQPAVSLLQQPAMAGLPEPELAYSDLFKYDAKASSPKIFLVAGGMENANFAQEVVDQKAHWLKAGFAEEDIACYYAAPLKEHFEEDETQYRALASDLAGCYPASPKLVWEHLSEAAKSKPDFLYLYVTAHGSPPLDSDVLRKSGLSIMTLLEQLYLVEIFPALGQYFVAMDVLPDGKTGNLVARLDGLHNGDTPEDHLFTPRYLKEALKELPEETPKFVSIQACYSGGFLESPEAKYKADTLQDVPNLTALTAARYDRSSFGCDSGSDRTYFGEVYNAALTQNNAGLSPLEIDWEEVYADVSTTIEYIESKVLVGDPADPASLEPITPSKPQYFSNVEK